MSDLWEHQKAAVDKARALDYFALFFEQGTGKTRTLISILRDKYQKEEEPFKTLILCPPIVIDNWKREILSYSYIPSNKIITLTGTAFSRLKNTDIPHDAIYITNYQALLMDKLFQRFLSFGFRAVVLDESHKIKSYNSKTTKRCQALGDKAQYRYCLTGTPVLNTAMDIYPQFRFLDGGKLFGTRMTDFRAQYFHDFNANMPSHCYFPNWKMKPDTTEKINAAIAGVSARVLKSDCLDLPPLIRQRVDCELTDEQADVYRGLEEEFVAVLGDSEVLTDLEITKCLRLQQIVSGYCPDSEGKIHEFSNNARIRECISLLDTLTREHKVIVWACFRENFRQLELCCASLGIKYVTVHGGTNNKAAACRQFDEDNSCRVLIGHPKSAGIGINLTSADYSIFFSRSYDLGDDLQAEARNYRAGSERHASVVRIDLVSPGTIDEVILEALASKQSLSDAILTYAKQRKERPWINKLSNRIKIA